MPRFSSACASRVMPYNARSRVPARDWIHSREHPSGIPRLPTILPARRRHPSQEEDKSLDGTRHDFYSARNRERERERDDRCYADARPGDVNGDGGERKSFGGD